MRACLRLQPSSLQERVQEGTYFARACGHKKAWQPSSVQAKVHMRFKTGKMHKISHLPLSHPKTIPNMLPAMHSHAMTTPWKKQGGKFV